MPGQAVPSPPPCDHGPVVRMSVIQVAADQHVALLSVVLQLLGGPARMAAASAAHWCRAYRPKRARTAS